MNRLIRKTVSLTALISFIVLIVNSIVLYVAPVGRVAHWVDWRIWGLTKEQWTDQHIITGILFLLAVLVHTYYNWDALLSYLKNKVKHFKLFTREFNLALILNLLFIAGAYFTVFPFNHILDLSAMIKDSAAVKYGSPPYAGAENSSLADFSKKTGYSIADTMGNLKKSGIIVDSEKQTLNEVAGNNSLKPQDIYEIIKGTDKGGNEKEQSPEESLNVSSTDTPIPEGLGSKTIAAVCDAYGIDTDSALKKLSLQGIDARPGDKMKSIADKHKILPLELFEILK